MSRKKCEKTQEFPSQGAALAAGRKVSQRGTSQAPLRAYWCGQHKAWHLTSKPPGQRSRR